MNIVITVKGAVQGIGYRPFIADLAAKHNIGGWVKNIGAAVEIFTCGEEGDLQSFVELIRNDCPPGGFILSIDLKRNAEASCDNSLLQNAQTKDESPSSVTSSKPLQFRIVDSSATDLSSEIPVFLPDIGICDDCLNELLDCSNRRYMHPLISCAVCGPRLSILHSLPYDRKRTAMKVFQMCPECNDEYQRGRRKYAQTISCLECGPQMQLLIMDSEGEVNKLCSEEALQRSFSLLKEGKILGLKGVSGYQLVCLPSSDTAKRLRKLKGRENKPFAVMFSSLNDIKEYAYVNEEEERLLSSSPRPIVLLNKKRAFPVEVDKSSRYVGAFLPSAGIHRLLCDAVGPLIVTSANKSGNPIITDDRIFLENFFDKKALSRASERVDAVLYHDRDIMMPQDDSVMFTVETYLGNFGQMIRRSRGFAPQPVIIPCDNKILTETETVLAFGGDLKSCFSFARNNKIMPSQYIGDLEDYTVNELYQKLLTDYTRIFEQKPSICIKDLHPGYYSGHLADQTASQQGISCIGLQHHFAHTYSVMAEYGLNDCIGVSLDGTGYGLDGNIWGGEFILVKSARAERCGHLSYVKLIGGDNASRNALLVKECYEHEALTRKLITKAAEECSKQFEVLEAGLENNINTFKTSSVGRLFDAVSALLKICGENTYEGECACLLEKCASDYLDNHPEAIKKTAYSFNISADGKEFIADQVKLFSEIHKDCVSKRDKGLIACKFHRAIVELIVTCCEIMRDKYGENKVCLSGGVFNNRILLKESFEELRKRSFEVFWNRALPLGDGAISAGQAYYGLLVSNDNKPGNNNIST